MLNNPIDLIDLKISPSNRLEKSSENLKDFYNFKINNQYYFYLKKKKRKRS